MVDMNPLVSIYCLVYNQSRYLRQCLDGFVMQKTDFPFEAVVHDDASTDGSADIIREYQARYPNIIKAIIETENQYSKPDHVLAEIMAKACTGKYIAMCEGDDYWTDPYKLQKQVDLLESRPDISLCFHAIQVLESNENIIVEDSLTRDVPGESSIRELAKENYIHTPSVMYRNNPRYLPIIKNMGLTYVGDYPLWMLCASDGNLYKLEDKMAVYRSGVGIWSSQDVFESYAKWNVMLAKLFPYMDKETRTTIDECIIANNALIKKEHYKLLNSFSYRAGHFITWPVRMMKALYLLLRKKLQQR